MVEAGALSLAFALGLGTFLSPCSVALLPAYVAYYAGLPSDARAQGTFVSLRAGLRFGAAASAGVATVFVVAGALVYWIRTRTEIGSFELTRSLAWTAILVALVLVTLGVLLVLGRVPSFTLPVTAPQGRAPWNIAAFGALYTLASLGCSLPLLFALIAEVAASTATGGFLLFLAYGAGLIVLMFAASLLLTFARERARRWIREGARVVHRVMGVVLIAAGSYVVWYYAQVLGNV